MYICNEHPMYISQLAVFTYGTHLYEDLKTNYSGKKQYKQ